MATNGDARFDPHMQARAASSLVSAAMFQMNGGGESNAAVHKAAGVGQPVTQEIAMSVRGDRVECAINGTVVASYSKTALVTAGKLKSSDGVYGLRFAHNTEVTVTSLAISKN